VNQSHPSSGTADSAPLKLLSICLLLGSLSLLMLLTGCSTAEMKGTPFYTGDHGKRQGAVEQRVNVWPLLYYREPALSVAWPVFELTDDHIAVRPLFSVYGLDEPKHEYNFLWPLAQFDQRTGQSRIIPFFWGDDYRIAMPLYWHFGEPWGEKGGSDTLFPLWHLSRKGTDRFNLYSPWPLVRFWADEKKDVSGSMILPLYYQHTSHRTSQFFSLFWLSETQSDGDYWRLLFPLYYQMANGSDTALATPLWQQGHAGEDTWRGMLPFWRYRSDGDQRYDLSAPWPLVRFWADGRGGDYGSRVLPLYWHNHEAGATQFYSLPWSCGSDANSSWRLLLPLCYQSSEPQRSTFITPLYSQGRVEAERWNMLFPLWYSSHESTNRFKLYSPIAYFWSDQHAAESGSVVFPLYWHQNQRGSSQFNSLLWMNHSEPNGDYWRLLPPLFYQEASGDRSKLITPLWAQGKSATNDWGAVIPFCYWDRQQHSLLSPLWAHWRNADKETWLAPWTLSWRTHSPERSDLNLLGGLARASWGEKPGADYIFPLYYNDARTGKLLSPAWLQWRDGETETAIAPWLLSWKTHTPERTDLWLAGGFARASWGEKPGADYVIPFFYHDSQSLLTPLFGWNHQADFAYYATPLAGVRTGDRRGSWLFPLYSHVREKATSNVTDNYLLLGGHAKTKERSRSWFIPLFYYQNRFEPESTPEPAPRYRTYGKTFWCLPICWYRDQVYIRPERKPGRNASEVGLSSDFDREFPATPSTTRTNAPFLRNYTRSHGCFPLWNHESTTTPTEGRSEQDTSVLLWLYDYKHDIGLLSGKRAGLTNDYTRSRVLWRLWHYEKLNGDVSVDVFPSFTYDRKPDGFKKVSFLWRFFRYEREANGETKVDALFIPLKR
jgi:hypothetical protein